MTTLTTQQPALRALADGTPWPGLAFGALGERTDGELWSQTAALEVDQGAKSVTLHTCWQGAALPYTLERTVTLTTNSARLRVDYSAINNSATLLSFIWCVHPLLAIEPGMALRFPESARFNQWAALPPDLIGRERDLRYPLVVRVGAGVLDLTTLPDASARIALKLWSDPLSEGWATLSARDGEFRMRWDVALLPQVAFWMNLGAWAADGGTPYFNLGLEPCIGAQDSLAEAVTKRNLFAALPPRGSRTWRPEVELAT